MSGVMADESLCACGLWRLPADYPEHRIGHSEDCKRMRAALEAAGRDTDQWRDKAFGALATLKTANDNCERIAAERDALKEQVEAAREALSDLLSAFTSMPDAALMAGDPRYTWWFDTAPQRDRARAALARLNQRETE